MRSLKTRRLLGTGGNILRAILILITLAGATTWFLWTWHGGLVEGLDERIVGHYEKRYNSRLDEAAALFGASKLDEAARVIDSLVSKIGEVRKEDRLSSIYLNIQRLRLSISESRGDKAKALRISKALVEFDPKHYKLWITYSDELAWSGRRAEAIEALFKAYAIAPNSIDVVERLAGHLNAERRAGEAREVVRGYMDANRTADIHLLYAAPGKKVEAGRSSHLRSVPITGTRQLISMPIRDKAPVSTLALGMTNLIDMDIKVHSVSIITRGGDEAIEPSLAAVRDLKHTGTDTFAITGPSPTFVFTFKGGQGAGELSYIEADLEFKNRFSQRLRNIMRGI